MCALSIVAEVAQNDQCHPCHTNCCQKLFWFGGWMEFVCLFFFCFLGGKQFKKTIAKRRPELGEVRLEGDNRPSNPVALTTGLRRDSADTHTTNPLCSAIGSQPFNWT